MKVITRRLAKYGLILLAALLFVITLLPSLFSIRSVNQFALSCLNSSISGKVYAEGIHVGWLGGLQVEGLEVHDPAGRMVASCQKIGYDHSLIPLLYSPYQLGTLQVKKPFLQLIDDTGSGNYSVTEVFASPNKEVTEQKSSSHKKRASEKKSASPPVSVALNVEEGAIVVAKAKDPEIRLSELNCVVDIQEGKTLTASVSCRVQEKREAGSLSFTVAATDLSDLKDAYEKALHSLMTGEPKTLPTAPTVEVQAVISHFPLTLADTFLSLANPRFKDLTSQAFGPLLDAKLSHTFKNGLLSFSTDIQSDKLKATFEIAGQSKGTLSWHIEPALFQTMQSLFSKNAIALQQPFNLQMTLDSPLSLSIKNDSPIILQASEWDGPLAISELIGKDLAIEADCQIANLLQPTMQMAGSLQIQAEHLKHQSSFSCVNNVIKVAPSSLSATLQPAAIQKLLPPDVKIGVSEFGLSCTLHSLEFPVPISSFKDEVVLDMGFHLLPCIISEIAQIEQMGFMGADVQLKKQKGQALELSSQAKLDFQKSAVKYQELLGKNLSLTVKAPIEIDQTRTQVHHLTAHIASETIDTLVPNLSCRILPSLSFDAEQPITTTLQLKKTAANLFMPLALKEDAIFTLTVDPFTNSSPIISANCELTPITIDKQEKTIASFRLDLPLQIDPVKKRVSGKILLNSLIDKTALQGTFKLEPRPPGEIAALPPFALSSDGSFQDLPTEVIGSAVQKPELASLLGPLLSGKWNIDYENSLQKTEPLLLDLKGEGLSLELALSLGKELGSLGAKDPLKLEWQLTPARASTLMQLLKPGEEEKLILQNSPLIGISCKKLNVPLEKLLRNSTTLTAAALLDSLDLDMALQVGKIDCKEIKQDKSLALAPLAGTVNIQGKKRICLFELNSQKSESTAGQIFIRGEASHLWNDKELQFSKAGIKFQATIKDFPLDILQTEKITAVAGSKVNADITADVKELREGKFKSTIDTPRLHSATTFEIKDGKMQLLEPLVAQYELTQEAAESLFKTSASSENPIKLWIDQKGFSIPLNPFSLKDMVIKSMKIEPGILTVKNVGVVGLLISLLKADVSSRNEVQMWLTPIYVDIKNGVVTCKRSDALFASAFPIATWGQVNLIKNTIDMTLGLSGQALSRAFALRAVDPEYLLQIPIHGTTQSPKFDTARATAKIAALKMQENKSNTAALIGGLLGVAAGAGEKEVPPPKPTTYPFPWQGSKNTKR